ncbi:MAG: chemotaxis protein CheW [Methanomicrobiales archaeon]|nr:chemotaxis protein CheW [Methanomicrobiales archaeon]
MRSLQEEPQADTRPGAAPPDDRGGIVDIVSPTSKRHQGQEKVVEFVLGGELYAIDLFDVREIVPFSKINSMPNVPTYIRGVISLRREITTIIDIRQILNVSKDQSVLEEKMRFIVLDERMTKKKMGILVDRVLNVSTVTKDEIDTKSTEMRRDNTYAKGIINRKVKIDGKDADQIIIWIDMRRIIQDIEKEI